MLNNANGEIVLTHDQRLSFLMAQADLIYITSALFDTNADPHGIRRWPFIQYGALVAYEAQLYFKKITGVELASAWDPGTAKAARMSAKYFEDRKKGFDGVVSHFQQLLDAHHEKFYPEDRLGPGFDFLRTDIGVGLLQDEPAVTTVGGYFMAGFPPQEPLDGPGVGARALKLAQGIANIAAQFGQDDLSAHGDHLVALKKGKWRDSKISEILPAMFAGELEEPLALATLTIQGSCVIASRTVLAEECELCRCALLKYRFVSLYQAALSLKRMSEESDLASSTIGALSLSDALQAGPRVESILNDKFRRLRNALVHFGLEDMAPEFNSDSTFATIVSAYTDLSEEAFVALVDSMLDHLATTLTAWAKTAPKDSPSFKRYLQKPD